MDFEKYMTLALEQASKATDSEPALADVPVGAVVIDAAGVVIGAGFNQRERRNDPTAHAEVEAIRQAAEHLADWRLQDCTLVVTLEPCVMCAGTIVAARVPRVVFGAWDERVGASGSLYDVTRDARLGNPVEVIGGVLEAQCQALLTQFFESRRMSGSK